MKKKSLNNKLHLKKQTISNLKMSNAKGGNVTQVNGCPGTWDSALYCETEDALCTNSCQLPCEIVKMPD